MLGCSPAFQETEPELFVSLYSKRYLELLASATRFEATNPRRVQTLKTFFMLVYISTTLLGLIIYDKSLECKALVSEVSKLGSIFFLKEEKSFH